MLTRISDSTLYSGYTGQQVSSNKTGSAETDTTEASDSVSISTEARALENTYTQKQDQLSQKYASEQDQLEQEYLREKSQLEREYSQKKQSLGINLVV